MAKRFFITGCTSGMGLHMTGVLARQGHEVFATARNFELLQQKAVEEDWPVERVHLGTLDVTDPDQWKSTFNEAVIAMGGVDVTMNIAGQLVASWVGETSLDDISRIVDVNLKGVMYGTQISAEHMVKQGHGHIVNMASLSANSPVPGLSAYTATKYAVRGFSITAGIELRKKNVFVSAICPAAVSTPMLFHELDNDAAKMLFSSNVILTVKDVETAILKRVLPKKPSVVMLPRSLNYLGRIADLMPWVGRLLAPVFLREGARRQKKLCAEHGLPHKEAPISAPAEDVTKELCEQKRAC